MASALDKLLIKPGKIQIKLSDKCKCNYHKNRNKHCKIVIDESVYKKRNIYDRFYIYEVEDYQFYCSDVPCRKYWLLQHSYYIINDDGSKNYVTFNNQRIFKCKSKYLSYSLIVYFNQITMNGQAKFIGILFFYFF